MKQTRFQKREKILRVFLIFSIFLLGIALGIALRHYYNIPLIEAINIVDVATLIVTVFLAVYIPGVFDKHLQEKQGEKEIIEHRLNELQGLYHSVNQQVQYGSESMKDVLKIDNILNLATNRIKVIMTLINYLDKDKALEEELHEIKNLHSRYEKLLMTSLPTEKNLLYPKEIRDVEEVIYNSLDKATSILVFKINRL